MVERDGDRHGSAGSGPARTSKVACRSATSRPTGPGTANSCWVMLGGRSGAPAKGTRPGVGRSAATPLARAGTRSDPPRSLASPSGAMPVATATASPPLDPPDVRSGSQGLRVAACRLESVCQRSIRSGRLVRAIGIAPAARAPSSRSAAASASSASTRVTALTASFTWPMRSKWAWTTSRALTCPERTRAASANADRPTRPPVTRSAMRPDPSVVPARLRSI